MFGDIDYTSQTSHHCDQIPDGKQQEGRERGRKEEKRKKMIATRAQCHLYRLKGHTGDRRKFRFDLGPHKHHQAGELPPI